MHTQTVSQRPRTLFFLVIFGILAVLVFFVFQPYLKALFLAAVFAVAFRRFHKWVLRALGNREALSALVASVCVVVVLVVPVLFFSAQMFGEMRDVHTYVTSDEGAAAIETTARAVQEQVSVIMPGVDISLDVRRFTEQAAGWVLQNVTQIFAGAVRLAFGVLLFLLALFFLFKDGDRMRAALVRMVPLTRGQTLMLTNRFTQSIRAVMRESIVLALLQGLFGGIGYWIFGVPNPVFWGSVTALISLLPGIGVLVIMLPIAGFLALTATLSAALGLVAWGVAAVIFIDNLLRQQLLKRGLSLHPLLVLLSVVGGIQFFGLVGFVLGPVILSLFVALVETYPAIFSSDTTA